MIKFNNVNCYNIIAIMLESPSKRQRELNEVHLRQTLVSNFFYQL